MAKLAGKRVLITQADRFMGLPATRVFEQAGADVIADTDPLATPEACRAAVEAAGEIDVLLVNLGGGDDGIGKDFVDQTISAYQRVEQELMLPLIALCHAAVPQMVERKAGKIVVFGSASGLRGIRKASFYGAVRASQIGFIQALGVELARHNVQANLIAQHYVDTPAYFPPELQASERFQAHLKEHVPAGRLGDAEDGAALALFLASPEASFLTGQAIPYAGGWVQ